MVLYYILFSVIIEPHSRGMIVERNPVRGQASGSFEVEVNGRDCSIFGGVGF